MVEADLPTVSLRVTARGADAGYSLAAAMNPADLVQLLAAAQAAGCKQDVHTSSCFLQMADGSDCVLTVRPDASVMQGDILLDDVQQHNLHILAGDTHTFRLFRPPMHEAFDLVELEGEVRLLNPPADAAQQEPVQVNAHAMTSLFLKLLFGRIVAVNELVVLAIQGTSFVVRITSAHTLPHSEREEALGYHCFRGRLTATTAMYLMPELKNADILPLPSATAAQPADCNSASTMSVLPSQAVHTKTPGATPHEHQSCSSGVSVATSDNSIAIAASGFVMSGIVTKEARPPPTNLLHVTTRDDDWFPVQKQLLRPCLALTKVVRDSGSEAPAVTVDVGTLAFDRVLLFLEAHALGRPYPQWSLHLLDELAEAARVLGLQPLTDYCSERLGQLVACRRFWRWEEVCKAIADGSMLLVLDGMVLDVTRWLPEHPGGASIIPKQALNLDCARFFEMYHASRESFLYLKDFYRGEVHPSDRPRVPPGSSEPPSSDFLQQLREFTHDFRLQLHGASVQTAFKSF